MLIHRIYAVILPWFRRKRSARFKALFAPGPATRILDVGGGLMHWKLMDCRSPITILNIKLPSERKAAPPNFEFVAGDGTRLAYGNRSYDIAFSNSVIEHVGDWAAQKRFAAEIRRVADRIWVQTPARVFFLEPHLLAPFVHWLPKSLQRRLLRWFTPWGLLTRPDQAGVDAFLAGTRLLGYGEMRELFPDCEIVRERFLGMTKSYVAFRVAPLATSAITEPPGGSPARSAVGFAGLGAVREAGHPADQMALLQEQSPQVHRA